MDTEHINTGLTVITILASAIGGGISAFVGVKLGQVRQQGEIDNLKGKVEDHGQRIERLERPFFDAPTTPR